jgi:serine/threonine-protein phosphatase 2B catalytic subunit
MSAAAPSPTTQTANAIRAIEQRANVPIPDIDFTVHELENGEIVRTDERVVKDVSVLLFLGDCKTRYALSWSSEK